MIRLAVAAPVRERCGIADYARLLAAALPGDIEVTWLPFPAGRRRADWRRLARTAARLDAVHVHYETGLFGVVKPLRNRFATLTAAIRAPKLVTLHDLPPGLAPRWRAARPYRPADLTRDLLYLPFFPAWERRQYRRADRWLVHSGDLAARVARHAGPDRVTTLPHPVPTAGRSWHRTGGGGLHLVTPGFLKRAKGLETLLEVVAALPGARWTLAGGPQDALDRRYQAEIEDRMVELGLQDRVRITGFLDRDSIEQHLATASAAVFPYRRASGSGALTWAIGIGSPIVASDLPAFRELRKRGAGVELVPAGDPAAWAAALRALGTDPDRRAALSNRNRTYAARHGYPQAAERLAELVRSLVGAQGRRA